MTVDDENSVYVGGIPYDSTEQSLRRDFSIYGAVVAVKIINDHGPRGKCYAFVTFTNPRSAYNAIDDMNGGTIGGRVVMVNGVNTRGRRPNFNRENIRRNIDKSTQWDRGRDRERDFDIDRDQQRNHNGDRSRDRDRSRDDGRDRDRGHDDEYDRNQARDHMLDRDRDRDRDRDEDRYLDDDRHDRSRNQDHDWEDDRDLDFDRDREMDRTDGHSRSVDKDKNQQSRKRNGSNSYDQRDGDVSSDSTDDFHDNVKEKMEQAIQKRDQLTKEISQMEEMLEGKKQHVLDLQKKTQKLEDALTGAKKLSSQQKMLLTKLHKGYQQVKDCSERLKSSEQELESLVDMARIEIDTADEVGT